MDLQEIIDIVDEFVRERFQAGDEPAYGPDLDLFDYGLVDSIDAVEIIVFLEERFCCEITQGDISKYPMNTVEEISRVVAGKLGCL